MTTLLVIEDDKLLGREIAAALQEGGYGVVWILGSEELEKALAGHAFSLIYLDIMLPGPKDGYKILTELKASEQYKHIPVVMLSNLGQMAEMDRAMELGALDYLIKANIDLDKLVEMTKEKFL
jgi:DNA-binding response OmpR family regulator